MPLIPKIFPPTCPFCNALIDRPQEFPDFEYPIGICQNCGAIYVYDASGYHLGAAFVEGLLFACNGDEDLAWNLLPEDDYVDTIIDDYDGVSHKIVSGGGYQGRKIKGKLVFIRLHDDIQEVTSDGVKKRAEAVFCLPKKKVSRSARFSKRLVEDLVKAGNLNEILSLAQEDTRVIPALQRLLYSVDERLRWQAIYTLGKVCVLYLKKRPDIVTKILNNLLYARSDSAASSWGALGAAAEIISQNPAFLKKFIPQFVSFFLDESARAEVLWGIGRIAQVDKNAVKKAIPALYKLVTDPNPNIKGHAAWCLGIFKEKPAKPLLEDLLNDETKIRIFIGDKLREITIAQLAKEAIENLE